MRPARNAKRRSISSVRSSLDLGDINHADGASPGGLAHDHLARSDEAARQEEHNVVAAARPIRLGCGELLPVELVSYDEGAATASLEVTLLEAFVGLYDLGLAVGDRREHEAIVILCGGLRVPILRQRAG